MLPLDFSGIIEPTLLPKLSVWSMIAVAECALSVLRYLPTTLCCLEVFVSTNKLN